VDHESYTEYLEGKHAEREVLEAASDSDDYCEDNGPETGADAIYIGYIASVGDREAMNCLEVVVECCFPEAICWISVCFNIEDV
jgi:hypothetical protein